METKKIIIWSSVGVGVLTISLLVVPKLFAKASKSIEDKSLPEEKNVKPSVGTTTNPNPIGDASEVKKFQDWMDKTHPNWLDNKTSLNKGAGYGNYGKQTSKAWGSYGEQYRKSGNPPKAQQNPVKAYSTKLYNPIYNSVGDIVPFRMAGKDELLGTLTGNIKKDFYGNPFAEFKQPDGKIRFAMLHTITFKNN